MSEHLLLGNTRVFAHDDRFAHSFQEGYLRFKLDVSSKPLSDGRIYSILAAALTNSMHLPREQAGFVVGWVAALLEIESPRHKELVALVGVTPRLKEQRANIPLSVLAASEPESFKVYGG